MRNSVIRTEKGEVIGASPNSSILDAFREAYLRLLKKFPDKKI